MQWKNAEDPVKSSAAPNYTSPEDLFTLDDKDNFERERERMINLLSTESETETKTGTNIGNCTQCVAGKFKPTTGSVSCSFCEAYKLVLQANPLASTAQQAATAILTLNCIIHLNVGLVKLESSQTAQDPVRAGIVNLANTE